MIAIRLSRDAEKTLKTLQKSNPKEAKLIAKRILQIREKGTTNNCRILVNSNPPQYRSRCGNYRIIYRLEEECLKISIIGHRRDVYRK